MSNLWNFQSLGFLGYRGIYGVNFLECNEGDGWYVNGSRDEVVVLLDLVRPSKIVRLYVESGFD